MSTTPARPVAEATRAFAYHSRRTVTSVVEQALEEMADLRDFRAKYCDSPVTTKDRFETNT